MKEPQAHDDDAALETQLAGLAALGDRVRRALYLHVASAPQEVSRDDAAQAVGVTRSLAGFHLDRLVAEGLLETSFRRLSGRSGPGAGRPSKLYRRARQVQVSLPPRRYELAAQLFATAVDDDRASAAREALLAAARGRGEALGSEARAQAGKRASRQKRLEALVASLSSQGYEPELADGEVRLRNCPFHGLVGEHTQLVCGMNLALLEGVVASADVPAAKAELVPRPGLCCVRLQLDGK